MHIAQLLLITYVGVDWGGGSLYNGNFYNTVKHGLCIGKGKEKLMWPLVTRKYFYKKIANVCDLKKFNCIIDKVELNPKNYHKFVDHLRRDRRMYRDIMEILDDKYYS